jgi:hypothetical protein
MNFALKAYVQAGDQLLVGTIPSKQVISFISGATNRNNQVATQTNLPVVSVTVSNTPFLITNDTGSYVFSSNYVLTNFSFFGNTTFTNNLDFTNDINFTEITNEPLTYTFNNQVQVSSNLTLLLFPQLQTGPVTAVQSTNDPGVFTLSGIVTNTAPIYQVMPDFSKAKGAKLVCVIPVVDVTNNLTPRFEVRYSLGRTVTNVNVSDFIFETDPRSAGYDTVRLNRIGFVIPQYGVRQFFVDTTFTQQQPGTFLWLAGLDQQARGAAPYKSGFAAIDVPRQRRLSGGGQGTLTGSVQSQKFTGNTCILGGSITLSGGHVEIGD